MSKIQKISNSVNTINTARNFKEVYERVEKVKNSKLTDEEKDKALKSFKKCETAITIIVILYFIFLAVFFVLLFCINMSTSTMMIITLISIILLVVVVSLLYPSIGKDFTKYYKIVDMGFDGLTLEEVNYLKPNDKEKQLLRSLKLKSFLVDVIFLIAIFIDGFICFKLRTLYVIWIIIMIVITVIWVFEKDSCMVEIHRIKSGYYKKSFTQRCMKCMEEIKINFNEIEKYASILPKNKDGTRTIKCPHCNNDISLYLFDADLKNYRNYLKKIK